MRILKLTLVAIFIMGPWLNIYQIASGKELPDKTSQRFQNQIDEIQSRISRTKIDLDGIHNYQETLKSTINHISGQINGLEASVNKLEDELVVLKQTIEDTKREIDYNQQILQQFLITLYKRSNTSGLRALLSTDSFTDYLDNQEYLEKLKQEVLKTIDLIEAELEALESHQVKVENKIAELEGQQVVKQSLKREQEVIIAETNRQETKYQALLADLKKREKQIRVELNQYLMSIYSIKTSLGPVKKGEIIAKLGNTGWSTGPHLHLVISKKHDYKSQKYDWIAFYKNKQRRSHLVWPVGGNGGWVSQGYHPGHLAVDIAGNEGLPIRAIADGEMIFRGCGGVGRYWANFQITLKHNLPGIGTFYSTYLHLQAPNNKKYEKCNKNLWPAPGRKTYGTKSIDYSTTY